MNWYKGTGGGSGLDNMFESWSDEKKNKFDIDLAVYDHTDISNRPVILMDGYTKKKPYLTVIYMWDKVKDLILSAKYDPLKKGRGEAGLRRDTDDMSITSTLSSGGVSKCSRKSSSRSSSTSKPTEFLSFQCKDYGRVCFWRNRSPLGYILEKDDVFSRACMCYY